MNKICPLWKSDCLKDRCGWWDEQMGMCSVRALSQEGICVFEK